jgi:hypothetical protein
MRATHLVESETCLKKGNARTPPQHPLRPRKAARHRSRPGRGSSHCWGIREHLARWSTSTNRPAASARQGYALQVGLPAPLYVCLPLSSGGSANRPQSWRGLQSPEPRRGCRLCAVFARASPERHHQRFRASLTCRLCGSAGVFSSDGNRLRAARLA